MSQPNRLIHSSGLLSFIRCNTDHERTPVSPVIPPLLFLHLSYMTCSHSSSAGYPENFTHNSESGQKYKNLALFPNNCLFNSHANVIYLQLKIWNPQLKQHYSDSKNNRGLQKYRHLVICEKTFQEFDIHLSQYHSLYPLSTLSFTDTALMLRFPSACIWVAYHRRKS